jgi:adenosylcobinamide kinase/adenosylcobinamide-phosphate guanylyltransferase
VIHLVTGGARAGKSRWVLEQAEATAAPRITFVATAQALDEEMAERIARHRAERSPRWHTVEEPLALDGVLPAIGDRAAVVDCLTLWISNLLFSPRGDEPGWVESRIDALVAVFPKIRADTWLVTNEVGLGIVPNDPISRRYRDLLGRCNQRVAAAADHATFVVSGLPMRLK